MRLLLLLLLLSKRKQMREIYILIVQTFVNLYIIILIDILIKIDQRLHITLCS